MKVINLDQKYYFNSAVYKLEDMVVSSGFKPDLIVGIPTGGRLVVEAMQLIPTCAEVCYISKQRKSTATKKKLKLHSLLPYLPRKVNDILRHFESWLLERNFEKKKKDLLQNQVVIIELDDKTKSMISNSKCILVVDDAIDSGQTVKSVVGTICMNNQDALVKVAVINTTFNSPLVEPDYCLFSKKIVRYPWANDVKQRLENFD